LPFPQPIHASRPIDTLSHLRNAATLVERECFLESAEQARLRWRSTVRQQQRGSRRQFLFQVRQDLLNDHRVLDAGNDLGFTSADTARLNVDVENPPASLAMKSITFIDDSYSKVHLASSTDTIREDSSTSTPPLLYSPLESTKIIQSLNLTDAITDDSYSNEHLASTM
jgi:hypothetical protein